MGTTDRVRRQSAARTAAEDIASSLSTSVASGNRELTAEALAALRQILKTSSSTREDARAALRPPGSAGGGSASRTRIEPRRQREFSPRVDETEKPVPHAGSGPGRRFWRDILPWVLLLAALIGLIIIAAPRPWFESLMTRTQRGPTLRGPTEEAVAQPPTPATGLNGTGAQGTGASTLKAEAQALAVQVGKQPLPEQPLPEAEQQVPSLPAVSFHILPLPPTPPSAVPASPAPPAKPIPARRAATAPAASPPAGFSMDAGLMQQMQNEASQLVNARDALAAGRLGDARQLMESVQAQLALQPITPDNSVPLPRNNMSAQELARALAFLGRGRSHAALAALDRAIAEFTAEATEASVLAPTETQ